MAFDPWSIDFYPLLRPLLFKMVPEDAHQLAFKLLAKGLGPKVEDGDDAVLQSEICGLNFRNPIGLAAGFDKDAHAIAELMHFGFGFVEIGTITPQPQPGNPQPRLFRDPTTKSIINRMGFNSSGAANSLRRIAAWHDATRPRKGREKNVEKRGLIGINVGKNKDSADAGADYVAGFQNFAAYADYITVNISSPNTPGLRDLQSREQLSALLQQVTAAREASAQKPPLFVKIAPDLDDQQMNDIAEVVLGSGVQGLIIGNTTIARPNSLPSDFAKESGGLSGKLLFEASTRVLAQMYKLTEGKIALIGCGGVSSGMDAYAKIRAGASLVQIYSALIFEGPAIVQRIKRELVSLLKKDGFKSVSEAVGKG